MFQYLIKYIRRGIRGVLYWLHIKTNNNKINKIYLDRELIVEEIINYNKNHNKKYVILIFTIIKSIINSKKMKLKIKY